METGSSLCVAFIRRDFKRCYSCVAQKHIRRTCLRRKPAAGQGEQRGKGERNENSKAADGDQLRGEDSPASEIGEREAINEGDPVAGLQWRQGPAGGRCLGTPVADCYAFPPLALLPLCLEKIRQDQTKVLLADPLLEDKFNKVPQQDFYQQFKSRTRQETLQTSAIICYLATFKLEDLGLQQFSKIIRSQDISKMYKFLSFFFDVINLSTWIKDDWSQIYDAPYVVENWITPLLRWQPEVEPLINQLHDKITNGCSPKKMDKIWTEPQEFNLTKPKPRAIPLPEKIPLQGKHQQVPPSTYKPPKEQQLLDEMKLKNRQKAEADNIPIRLNTTAILREGALYNRRVEQELRKIEKLVEGARDPSEFMAWQRQMRERDMEEKLAEVERRRLEGRLSHEEAVLARHKIIQENKKKATLKKEETAGLMRRYAEKRLEEEKGMKELVEQVVEGHKNARQAKAKILECKQRIVQEVTEESQELLRQALEKAEAELIRKFELIRQIRAIESVPLIRHKFVDHTQPAEASTVGHISASKKADLRKQQSIIL
ncbi:UNVERIFIED_CONTAM: hypothetical protein FKN15_004690 [Acipenser sinensis]